MFQNEEDNSDLPEKRLEVSRGGSGRPPRRTALGLADFGEFGNGGSASRGTGLKDMWMNYILILSIYFKKMRREDQEQLIVRACQVVMVLCSVAVASFFYPYVESLHKVVEIPLFFVFTWFVATRVLSPIVIVSFEDKLNTVE